MSEPTDFRLDIIPSDGQTEAADIHDTPLLAIDAPGHVAHGEIGRVEMSYYSWYGSDYTMFWLRRASGAVITVLGCYLKPAL